MKTCLVIDESCTVRKVARRILEDLGFQVTETERGLEALRACRSAMPQAILLDWRLPDMSGPEFLRRLRTEAGDERPRILVAASEARLSAVRAALEAGAHEVVLKPFDAEILGGKLALAGVA